MGIKLSDDIRRALKAGEKEKLSALRLMHAAIQQREIDTQKKLDDRERMHLLSRLAKQRQESISQFAAAGRQDLVDKEKFELSVIRSYLPEPLDDKAIEELVEKTITELKANGMKDMGQVMRALKEAVAGRAEMSALSQLVRKKLQRPDH